MEAVHVKFSQTDRFDKSADGMSKIVHEYNTAELPLRDVDVAYTKVEGSYPSKGYAANEVCTMIYYVLSGDAILTVENGTKFSLQSRDVLQLPPKTRYRIEGNFEALMICAPVWYKEQSLVKV